MHAVVFFVCAFVSVLIFFAWWSAKNTVRKKGESGEGREGCFGVHLDKVWETRSLRLYGEYYKLIKRGLLPICDISHIRNLCVFQDSPNSPNRVLWVDLHLLLLFVRRSPFFVVYLFLFPFPFLSLLLARGLFLFLSLARGHGHALFGLSVW